jgi:hypothetical protein
MVEEVNDADHLLEHAGEIVGIYAAAFGPEPELAADRFAAALAKHAERDGFRCCLAYMNSQPVGFIYGFTAFAGKPPSPWYARVRDVAGAEWIEGQSRCPGSESARLTSIAAWARGCSTGSCRNFRTGGHGS